MGGLPPLDARVTLAGTIQYISFATRSDQELIRILMKICEAKVGDSVFLACGKEIELEKILSIARDKIANDLNIINKGKF